MFNQLNIDGCGQIEIPVETWEDVLKNKELDLPDYIIEAIKNDIAWAKKEDEDYILYSCW